MDAKTRAAGRAARDGSDADLARWIVHRMRSGALDRSRVAVAAALGSPAAALAIEDAAVSPVDASLKQVASLGGQVVCVRLAVAATLPRLAEFEASFPDEAATLPRDWLQAAAFCCLVPTEFVQITVPSGVHRYRRWSEHPAFRAAHQAARAASARGPALLARVTSYARDVASILGDRDLASGRQDVVEWALGLGDPLLRWLARCPADVSLPGWLTIVARHAFPRRVHDEAETALTQLFAWGLPPAALVSLCLLSRRGAGVRKGTARLDELERLSSEARADWRRTIAAAMAAAGSAPPPLHWMGPAPTRPRRKARKTRR